MNEKLPLTQAAYTLIKKMIIDMQFRPGETLLVQQLANRLDLSRTPVREALVKLSHEGLVEVAEGRKFRVTEINIDVIREIYELREAYEVFSVKKLIPIIVDQDIFELEKILSLMAMTLAKKDYNKFVDLDVEFHQYIIFMAGNSIMNSFVRQIDDLQRRIRYLTAYIDHRMENTIQEHERIIIALKERNLDQAIEAVKAHLNNVQSDYINLMQNGETKYYGSFE